ncbi:MAG: GPW/gp25 family protein [Thiofilum sp.]|uniref:GPW/gp25 family protein n=1 Tax=Thiofilum sp. TaxID=2212733 RepID=UPI0025EC846F|nr:GPW/gp25 family protein [Thiofilum sp.]MBK8454763.1 GPW/gp25 family protein [Thiofilum sp.]
MQPAQQQAFLGQGLAFPLRLVNGEFAMNAAEAQVQQSILSILQTNHGERVMRPEFGANLNKLAFEPLSPVTAILAQEQVKESLLRFEPRIDLLTVNTRWQTQQGEMNTLLIDIHYRIRATDTEFNLVFPFYLERGHTG